MSVVVLTLAYDGTDFHGWARQRDPSIRTIEGELASHLERVLREPVKLSVAGRTDAGVHARGQVASFRTASSVEPDRLRKALNTALAPEVVVVRASRAPDGFDARFSASAREYRYRIERRTSPIRSPLGSSGIGGGVCRSRRCVRPLDCSWGSTTSGASAAIPVATVRRFGT